MTSIAGQAWLEDASVREVMAALEAARPGGSRFVGGCVRNTLRGKPVDDIDIATQLQPDAVMQAMKAASIRALPTGIDHGTVTAIAGGRPFEITTLRRDVETDGRRAVVAFTEDWEEDAARRDFRLNAVYAEADGTLHDPTGGGIEDAGAGRVIFIGDADTRLREDYLRILRFFRFNAWYGAGIDEAGLAACARQKDGLKQIAAERTWKELKKLLSAPDPVKAMRAMADSGVLAVILPKTVGTDGLHDLHLTEQLCRTGPDPMQRLMAIIPRSLVAVRAVAKSLRLSNAEAARLQAWVEAELPDLRHLTGRGLRSHLYRHGKQPLADRAMLSAHDVRDLLAAIRAWKKPDFPIGGDDALEAGLEGPEIGRALRQLEAWWVEEDFTPDREALLKELARA